MQPLRRINSAAASCKIIIIVLRMRIREDKG